MKTGHWPKNGTVGTSPGRVRDMSSTSATKLLKIVLNNKAAIKNNKMTYSYYPKNIKEYGSALISLIYNTPVDH